MTIAIKTLQITYTGEDAVYARECIVKDGIPAEPAEFLSDFGPFEITTIQVTKHGDALVYLRAKKEGGP